MNDDGALLRSYAESGSETAFAAVVNRHLDLVYGAALRRMDGDAHAAADVAQQVFTTLARRARHLADHPVLSAWLHTATRNAALNHVQSEQSRKARERAVAEDPSAVSVDPDWDSLRPVLDATIDELPEPDRLAVVLRFLDRRPYADIGKVLAVSEDSARMRTERALEKMRRLLARRGITSTATALGAVVSTHAIVAAPAGLAVSITAAASATGAGAGILAAAAFYFMNQKIIVAGIAVVVAFGAGAFVGLKQQVDAPLPSVPVARDTELIDRLRNETVALRAEVARLQVVHAEATAARAPTRAPTPAPAAMPPPEASALAERQVATAMKQRAMLNNLRQLAAATDQFQLEYRRPPASLDELVGPTKYVRALNSVDGETYDAVSLAGGVLTVTSPAGVSVTYDRTPGGTQTTQPVLPPMPAPLREMQERLGPAVQKAMAAYQAAHGTAKPPETEEGAMALLPYFSTPQEGADFVEVVQAMKATGRIR